MAKWQQLIRNSKLIDYLLLREKIVQAIREFFLKNKFHEIETPLLVPAVIPESYLDPFTTTLVDRRRNKRKMFLTPSPESSLKKLLVAGVGNCYEITRSFRNGETDSFLHSPEFTILEWYRIDVDYREIMNDCETLFGYILNKIKDQKSKIKNTDQKLKISNNSIFYKDQIIDLTPPWERISVVKALQKYAGISFDDISQTNKLIKVAKVKGYTVSINNTWEEIFNQIFLNEIEPHLGTHGNPTIIYEYPLQMAALAKLRTGDPRLSERFELYIGGLELGDCYTELTDWKEQQKRFTMEMKKIKIKKKYKINPDVDFIASLQHGLPKCAGMAMGIDRMVMLFGNISDIRDSKFTV